MPKKKPLPVPEPENEENNDTPILTADEAAFIDAYFRLGFNGTQAYLSFHENCTYQSARASASRLLAKDNIRSEIKGRLDERAMGAGEALALMADIARGSHKPFLRYGEDGFPYFNLSDPEAQASLHIIKKIKSKRERRVEGEGEGIEEWEGEWFEVELYDSQAALRDILKMHGKFVDKVDLTSGGKVIQNPEIVNRAISTLALAIKDLIPKDE